MKTPQTPPEAAAFDGGIGGGGPGAGRRGARGGGGASRARGRLVPSLTVKVAGVILANPVMVASGTFGFGREYAGIMDVGILGGIFTKSVTLKPRRGNPPSRLWETPAGLLNSIGLQNPGVRVFVEKELPFLSGLGPPIFVNVAGAYVEEYVEVARMLDEAGGVAGLEINVSCPNVKEGCLFGSNPSLLGRLVREVRQACSLPLIVKLTPNAGDLRPLARAAEAEGADGLSMINTILGMAIDPESWRPRLSTVTGGLSGPAVKPVAVRMVHEVAGATSLPIIGLGGITSTEDALEFILAGATAVAVGTAAFVDPDIPAGIIRGLSDYLGRKGLASVDDLVGKVRI